MDGFDFEVGNWDFGPLTTDEIIIIGQIIDNEPEDFSPLDIGMSWAEWLGLGWVVSDLMDLFDEFTEDDDENEEVCVGMSYIAPDGTEQTLPPGFTLFDRGPGQPQTGQYMIASNGAVFFTPHYYNQALENYNAMMESNAEVGAFFTFGGISAGAGVTQFGPEDVARHNLTLVGLFLALPAAVTSLLGLTPPPPIPPTGPLDGSCDNEGG